MYDKPNNESFTSRLASVQYKACLAKTCTIQGTSREHVYKELGLKSLSDRKWVCKLTFFYKIVKGNSRQHLSNYLKRDNNSSYNTKSASEIILNTFRTRTEKFKNSLFPCCDSEWNKLSNLIKQSENIKKIKNTLIKDIKSNEQLLFSIHDPQSVKLLSRLNFSHLNEHKFRY